MNYDELGTKAIYEFFSKEGRMYTIILIVALVAGSWMEGYLLV